MNVLGVNAGNGVVLHPFKKSLIANIEIRGVFHTKDDLQWRCNFGEIPIIKKLDSSMNLPYFKDVDVIISHPDCGHSSILAYSRAKKMGNPKENKSMTLFFKSVNYYKPKVFLMENLPKLLETYGEKDIESALPGYTLVWHNISVSELGNSQINRVRLLLIGVRNDQPKFIRTVFTNLYKVNKLKKSGQLIWDLKKENREVCNIREKASDYITLYAGYKDFLSNIQQEWDTIRLQDGRWKVKDRNFTTAPGVYRNREFDAPNTVRPANRQFNHWGLMMGPRELARIMGIPDSYILYHDTKTKDYKLIKYQINKARVTVGKTPPYEVGLWFYHQINKIKKYLFN